MREAGFGGGFNTYNTITVDNGINIAGDEATGNLVKVSYDEENKRQIKSYGKSLEGVVLSSKALLTYRRGNKVVARSDEFNPLLNRKTDGEKALIPIYLLDDNGKIRKTPDNKTVVNYAYFEDLKKAKEDGVKNMDYDYTIILYFLITEEEFEGEIVKIKFKGASRGNFFNLSKELWKRGKYQLPEAHVQVKSYLEKKYNKYAIAFKPVETEDGKVKLVNDKDSIWEKIQELLQEGRDRRANFLPPSKDTMLPLNAGVSQPQPEQPQEELPPVEVYQDQASSEPEDDDEIKIEDIPF